jgi:peroxiredoxin
VQLIEISDQFEDMGIAVVALTYDSVETLKTVEEDQGVEFTMLHDADVKHVDAFGIRNPDYEPDHRFYGIPLPGMFLISSDGVIQAKFGEEGYRVRPDFADVLEAAAAM